MFLSHVCDVHRDVYMEPTHQVQLILAHMEAFIAGTVGRFDLQMVGDVVTSPALSLLIPALNEPFSKDTVPVTDSEVCTFAFVAFEVRISVQCARQTGPALLVETLSKKALEELVNLSNVSYVYDL